MSRDDAAGPVGWKETFYGWYASAEGHGLTVRKYRAGDGGGWTYVGRVDNAAATSPAQAWPTEAEAKRDAETLLLRHLAADRTSRPKP